MSRVSFAFALVLFLAVASATEALHNDEFSVLSEIDKEPFGSSMLSALSVHMHTESPMTEITKLLHQVAVQLRKDQKSANKAWVVYHFACKTDIRTYDNAIFFHTKSLAGARKLKLRNSLLLGKGRVSLAIEKKSLKSFVSRLASGTVLRAKQQAAFVIFKKEYKGAIRAIAHALALVNKLHTTSFIQLQSSFSKIITELNSHKHLHTLYTPLLSVLTDLHTNVSPQNVKRIRHLLRKIRVWLIKTLRFERKINRNRKAAWKVLSADLRSNIKSTKSNILQLKRANHLYKRTIV